MAQWHRSCTGLWRAGAAGPDHKGNGVTTTVTDEELLTLARQAGLDQLPPEYMAQLAAAYARIREMVAVMPTGRPRGDEPAHAFAAKTFLPAEG
jgi:hypothetical protein